MAVTSGKPKERISISIGHTNLANIKKVIDHGEFSSVSEVIDKALSSFFDNQGKTAITKEWLLSPEGKELIQGIMRNVNEEK